MKKFLRKTLLIVMLMLCTSSIVFADTEGENGGLFSHINKLENNKYTGLKDSLKKRIYNNDIIKVHSLDFCVYFKVE